MVELSLKHRVKMEEMAQIAGSGVYTPRSRVPFIVAALIAGLNVILLCLGVVVTAIIPYDKTSTGSRPVEWYKDGSAISHRVRLAFYYCTIPLVLSAISSLDAFLLHQGIHRAIWMLASCLTGITLWIVQWGLEGSCIWSLGAGGAYCPFAYAGWAGFQQTGLALAWVLPWLCVPLMFVYVCYLVLSIMALRTKPGAAPELSQVRRTYSYGQVLEEEGQDGHLTPDPRAGRLSTSRSVSPAPEQMMQQKEREMV